MGHKHSVQDAGARFTIDQFTRQIKNASVSKTTIVQYDHNSERLTFEMPLYVDGHAMTLCDLIEIHYINISADGEIQNHGTYEVKDIKAEGEKAIFTWLISQEATQLAGSLNFFIVFKCTENGVTVYRWGTEICKTLAISTGMDNGETVLTEYPDILAQWKAQLFDASNTAVVNVATAEASALAAIEAAGEAKKQAVLDSIPDEYEALSALADQNHRNKAGAIVVEEEGESIVLNDASEYPLQNLRVFGKSSQDGTPTPDAPVDIVSVENPAIGVYGKNLINNTLLTSSNGGITYTTNSDGSITINGTATNESYYKFDFQNEIPIKNVDLILSIKGGVGKASITVGYFDEDGNVTNSIAYTDNSEKLFAYPDEAKQTRTFITVPKGTVCENVVVYPMIRFASFGDDTYEHYARQTVETTHILNGIPVSSGGNYTDENGQEWICDEVDLARGVYVQRVVISNRVNIESVGKLTSGLTYGVYSVSGKTVSQHIGLLSSTAKFVAKSQAMENTCYENPTNIVFVGAESDTLETLREKFNGSTILYTLQKPIETALFDAEINAFKELHTNKPNTTILNDAGAYMAVEYVADTKTYIDNKIKEMMEGVE